MDVMTKTILLTTTLLMPPLLSAQEPTDYDECLLTAIKSSSSDKTLEQVRKDCQSEISETQTSNVEEDLVSQRLKQEKSTEFEPFVMTAHRMNYILPIVYTDDINRKAYEDTNRADGLRNTEAEFQISLKVPLNYGDMLFENDALFFGFTLRSYWQVYSESISRPFRETNYQPELYYFTPIDWKPFGGNTWLGLGVEHQSNGQTQVLSRSWNRIYGSLTYERKHLALNLRPWWRIPEDDKKNKDDPNGDDNPDITKYMGHFQLTAAYKWNKIGLNFTGRENFATHKGFAELGLTFPIWGNIRGYAKYSTGYGESLIDYNHNQQRIGVGIAMSDLL